MSYDIVAHKFLSSFHVSALLQMQVTVSLKQSRSTMSFLQEMQFFSFAMFYKGSERREKFNEFEHSRTHDSCGM